MTDLTERLRDYASAKTVTFNHVLYWQTTMDEAATTLETLTQENARLRFNKREWAEHFALHLNPDRDLKGNPLYLGDPAWSFAEAAVRFANSPARKALGGGDES